MIKGYAEVMRDIPGENTPENVQVIIDETERLSGLVNDMLDISKLKAGTITIQPEEYNITESIRHVLQRYNKLREVDGYIIDFNYDSEVIVYADEQKMYQVLYNLINNAINYTGDDKKVTVTQKVLDNVLRIEVKDTGDGVKQEDIPYVWDRYYKDSSTHKRAIQGTGLGLSIVKNVLELHGARYGVFSTQGQGATFWFEIVMDPFREDDE
jgi:signal transduction histidine kinase